MIFVGPPSSLYHLLIYPLYALFNPFFTQINFLLFSISPIPIFLRVFINSQPTVFYTFLYLFTIHYNNNIYSTTVLPPKIALFINILSYFISFLEFYKSLFFYSSSLDLLYSTHIFFSSSSSYNHQYNIRMLRKAKKPLKSHTSSKHSSQQQQTHHKTTPTSTTPHSLTISQSRMRRFWAGKGLKIPTPTHTITVTLTFTTLLSQPLQR